MQKEYKPGREWRGRPGVPSTHTDETCWRIYFDTGRRTIPLWWMPISLVWEYQIYGIPFLNPNRCYFQFLKLSQVIFLHYTTKQHKTTLFSIFRLSLAAIFKFPLKSHWSRDCVLGLHTPLQNRSATQSWIWQALMCDNANKHFFNLKNIGY